MATQPKRDFPQSAPFITDSERTAFCAANEITAPGPTPSQSPPISEEQALAMLASAIKERHSGSASSSSPPMTETETNEKKTASAKGKGKGKKRAYPFLAPVEPATRSALENAVKLRIIELFAQFYTAASIKVQIELEFEISLDIKQIASYNPERASSACGKKLRDMFVAMRQEYVKASTDMAMAHQAHRLRLIGDVVEKATNSRDYTAALKGLELAAKEMGGVLEGKQTVIHSGAVAHVHGTIEDARQEVAMRLAQLVDGGLLLPSPSVDAAPSCSSDPAAPPSP